MKPGVMPSLFADTTVHLPGAGPSLVLAARATMRRRQRHSSGAIHEVRTVRHFVDGVDVLGALAEHLVAGAPEQVLERLVGEVGLVAHGVLHVLRHRLAPDRIVGKEPARLRAERQRRARRSAATRTRADARMPSPRSQVPSPHHQNGCDPAKINRMPSRPRATSTRRALKCRAVEARADAPRDIESLEIESTPIGGHLSGVDEDRHVEIARRPPAILAGQQHAVAIGEAAVGECRAASSRCRDTAPASPARRAPASASVSVISARAGEHELFAHERQLLHHFVFLQVERIRRPSLLSKLRSNEAR